MNIKPVIILGSGTRGLHFSRILHQDLHTPVVAVADTHEESHELIRGRLVEFGLSDTRVFRSLEEAMGQSAAVPGAIFIMTPEWTHLDIFRRALAMGCPIFLEKPLGITAEEVLEIEHLGAASGQLVQVGFVLRYAPFYRKVKEVVDSGVLGRLVVIQMNERLRLSLGAKFRRTWHRKIRYTGGFINEKCCHDLDLMCWIKECDAEPRQVFSYGGTHFCPPRPDTAERCGVCTLPNCPWRYTGTSSLKSVGDMDCLDETSSIPDRCVFHSDLDIHDHQSVQILFADGTQGLLTSIAMSADPGRDITIHGTDGFLTGSLEKGHLCYRNYWESKERNLELGCSDEHGGADTHIVREFLETIARGNRPFSSIRDGVRASLLAFAADMSVERGQPVGLRELYSGPPAGIRSLQD